MLAFIIRRALQAIGVLLAVGIIAFAMFRFAGDPVNQIVSIDTPAAEREQVRRSLGLDDPVPVQFAALSRAAPHQGDFGISYQFRQQVSTLLAERMPATLELAICATLFALVFGVLMGVYSALRRDSLLAKVFQAVSLIGISLPTFLIGILLIYLFSVTLGWLPSYGRGDTVRLGWWTTGLLTKSGLQALDHALRDPRAVPDDADHAPRARRDAGGAAHRLHPLRPRPRPDDPGDPFRPRPEEHPRARSSPSSACSSAR